MKVVFFADMPEPEHLDRSQAVPGEELTWERVVAEEPEVGRILDELREVGRKRDRWKLFPKARLAKLVGWNAVNPRLRSQAAYEMTMRRMWDLLL